MIHDEMDTAAREDPSLRAVVLPGTPASFGGVEAPVVRAAVAGPTPFLLAGDRVTVTGTERRGLTAVRIDGLLALADLSTDAGPAANVVVGPATLRRELVGARGSVIENLLAVPALPVVAVRWSPPAGGRDPGGLSLEVTLLPGVPAVRYGVDGGSLRVGAGSDETVVDVVVHPQPTGWSVRETHGGGIRARAVVEERGPITLLVAAGSGEQVARALAAAPYLSSHEIRAAAASDPTKMDTLVVRSGVGELDDGVVWATARVHTALRRPGALDPEAIFWSGVGALAVGDTESARRALTLLGEIGRPEPLSVLLAARYALATGDRAAALEHLDRLDPETLESLRSGGPNAWSRWSAALGCLADALHQSASPSELDGLRAAAARPPAGTGSGLRLPMAGDARPGPASWPGHLLGSGGRRTARPGGSPPAVLAPWIALRDGRADPGYAAWRQALAEGLAGGPAGRGTWDPASVPGAPAAGTLLATLAHGLLGIDPDAPSGRLRIAPALPSHIRAFTVENIRLAEARVTLDYRREEGVHRYRLEPLGGRIPVMAVFEPSLPPGSVAAIRVDGSEADLERSSEGGRTRLRVQLPLDRTRTLEVEGG